jgi:hypothetical protein
VKRKKQDWSRVPWTEFVSVPVPPAVMNEIDPPTSVYVNSRYQVTCYVRTHDEPWGVIVHLSIKTHDKQPRHDWRDLQRIKNEIVGPQYDAVEVYPDEAKLVDTANQYHLFVFGHLKLPFGFQSRLVADGISVIAPTAAQRPFEPGQRPPDCLDGRAFDKHVNRVAQDAADQQWAQKVRAILCGQREADR